MPYTEDENSGTMRYRCEPCDVEECGHCGTCHLVTYSESIGWHHVEPLVECFLHGALVDWATPVQMAHVFHVAPPIDPLP